MSKTFEIVISPGDGIGHEIIGWVQKTLETVSKIDGGFTFSFIPIEVGLGAYKKTGEAISTASLDAMRSADATLLVAIAAAEIPKNLPNPIMVIRKELDLYANMRPLKDYSHFAPKGRKVDLIVVRENTEGFYSGIEYPVGLDAACAVRVLTRRGSERIARVVFKLAHGTAPGRAGKGIANPIATLLSAKLMLDYLGERKAGSRIQKAVDRVVEKGEVLTPYMGGENTTDQIGEAIIRELLP